MAATMIAAQRRTAKAAPTPPQTEATNQAASGKEVRIALINTAAFGDDKEGIIRFRDAVKALELEFRPQDLEIQNLRTRYETLSKEVETLAKASVVSQESLKAKREEVERVGQQIKEKEETAQRSIQKRYQEVTGPISRDIGNALMAFAEERGITLTLDISKLLPAILTIAPGADLTKEFIAEYNSKHPASTAPAKP
jgi:Skp family chaperone for outer membrane proteins